MADENAPQGDSDELAVAIVGMAGRFPGAPDVEAFWRNVRAGVESITFFSDEELLARGVDPAALLRPGFVRASPVLDGIARFDAALFGYAPREAELLDPQQRILLECAWAALEHAGYDGARHPGAVGVFAGASLSSYLLFNLMTRPEIASAEDTFPVMVANDKDFVATRISYHLRLRGPSLDVQTGCSTSLVAVHLACQALLGFQCDMALAGGVSVHMPQRAGYHHEAGGITSPDGHCRAFDARAAGTLFGSGAGLVVLKRLEDARADGDTIYAVIKGSAINNDGGAKVGFTAPGVEGQAEVIARAQAVAGVSPDTIGYVEAHGTATQLGDSVEVAALTQAFRAGTGRAQFCALGSVKTNIGHLDAAAGVTGLIKAVQALRYGELPPSLHFERPNPRLELESSPFYVNAELKPWPRGDAPRRAGVSSFGIGGTNAHVVLEEAGSPGWSEAPRPFSILPLSAKTRSALDARSAALAAHLREHPEQTLDDVAFTLQMGRKALEHRRVVVASAHDGAWQALKGRAPQRAFATTREAAAPSLVFMFAGGGAQHVNMGRGLYRSEPAFRSHVDRCCEAAGRRLGVDLLAAIYPDPAREEEAARQMKRTSIGLPALFAVQSAMAALWRARGVRPEAIIGHSLGEYAAAWLAGVMSLEEAVALVVRRGELFEGLPAGGMIGVPLGETEARALAGSRLSIAAVNGPSNCVLAGTAEDIEALAAELARQEVEFRRVQIDVAAHSHLVDPIVDKFRDFVASLRLSPPSVPFVSNVTGAWITPEQAVDPAYWALHLRSTVRFGDGVRLLLEGPGRVLLEVGPGKALSTLAKLQASGPKGRPVLASMRHPQDATDDDEQFALTTGRLWLAGVDVDWAAMHGSRRRRVPLPTYPFEGREYWLAPRAPRRGRGGAGVARKHPDVTTWSYQPVWERRALGAKAGPPDGPRRWLLLLDDESLGRRLGERLVAAGHEVVLAGRGPEAAASGAHDVDPRSRESLAGLFARLRAAGQDVHGVVHLVGLTSSDEGGFHEAQARGFYSLLALAQAFEDGGGGAVEVVAVGSRSVEVESADRVAPERATALAACKVLPQEAERFRCRYVDVDLGEGQAASERLAEALAREVEAGADPVVALRGRHRWVQDYAPLPLPREARPTHPLRRRGVYLITGGLGGVGLRVAEHLARAAAARLVLVSRSGLPPTDAPAERQGHAARTRAAISRLEAMGAEIMIARADVADAARMSEVLEAAVAHFGALHGVVHAAGLAGEDAVALASTLDPASGEAHFRAKALGAEVLGRVLSGRPLDFCLLISSNASVLGGLGLAAYAAANTYLDAFAAARAREPGARWISASWDGWPPPEGTDRGLQTSIDQFAMTPDEAADALDRVLTSAPAGHVVVSTGDLDARLDAWVRREASAGQAEGDAGGEAHVRPELDTPYAPPTDELERSVVAAWQGALGLDRIGVNDNFFDLGGNSLLWLKVIKRLKAELGRDVPLTAVFEAPSAAALAALLGRVGSAAPAYQESQERGAARRQRRNRDA
ncbi:MAG: SDR family NAD(P)-dependent oxidoreductase [Polyangiaceae bacterium]|jgi:acyl transferase domain-containing protein|nr:SDR family NAD(P)-dependent oxidoreductase [Polyangiaceae bacterium]